MKELLEIARRISGTSTLAGLGSRRYIIVLKRILRLIANLGVLMKFMTETTKSKANHSNSSTEANILR